MISHRCPVGVTVQICRSEVIRRFLLSRGFRLLPLKLIGDSVLTFLKGMKADLLEVSEERTLSARWQWKGTRGWNFNEATLLPVLLRAEDVIRESKAPVSRQGPCASSHHLLLIMLFVGVASSE